MCDNAAEGRRIADGMNTWFPYGLEILQVTEQRGILAEGLKIASITCKVIKVFCSIR